MLLGNVRLEDLLFLKKEKILSFHKSQKKISLTMSGYLASHKSPLHIQSIDPYF